jgi:hypothetical protein
MEQPDLAMESERRKRLGLAAYLVRVVAGRGMLPSPHGCANHRGQPPPVRRRAHRRDTPRVAALTRQGERGPTCARPPPRPACAGAPCSHPPPLRRHAGVPGGGRDDVRGRSHRSPARTVAPHCRRVRLPEVGLPPQDARAPRPAPTDAATSGPCGRPLLLERRGRGSS